MDRPRGLTLIELVSTVVLISLLAVGSVGLVQHVVQTSLYLPNESRTAHAASEVLEAATEGSPTRIAGSPELILRGLRFAKRRLPTETAIQVATAQEVQFFTDGACETNPQRCLVRLRLESPPNRLLRSYRLPAGGFSVEESIPYFTSEGLQVMGTSCTSPAPLFRYLDAGGNDLGSPVAGGALANIRRVEVIACIQTGSGDIEYAEGRLTLTSSVAIRFP